MKDLIARRIKVLYFQCEIRASFGLGNLPFSAKKKTFALLHFPHRALPLSFEQYLY